MNKTVKTLNSQMKSLKLNSSKEELIDWLSTTLLCVGKLEKVEGSTKQYSYSINTILETPEDDMIIAINQVSNRIYELSDTLDKPCEFRLYTKVPVKFRDESRPKVRVKSKDGIVSEVYPLSNMLDDDGNTVYRKPSAWYGTPSAVATVDGVKSEFSDM